MPPRVSLSQDVAELTACCASARERQKHVKEQLRRIHRRDQKARARSRASWQNMITFGVMVLAIVGAEFGWVPNLLSRFQQTAEPEEVQDEITKKYLELSVEDLRRLLEPEGRTSAKHPLNQAHAFAAQFCVWNWVDAQNRSAGVAPSVADVIKQRNSRLHETQSGIWGEFTDASSTKQAASCKWVARWKRDWNLAFGKASEHEVLPTATVRTKALTEYPMAQNRRTRHRPFKCSSDASLRATGLGYTISPPRPHSPTMALFPSRCPRAKAFQDPRKTCCGRAPKKEATAVQNGTETRPILRPHNAARLLSWC